MKKCGDFAQTTETGWGSSELSRANWSSLRGDGGTAGSSACSFSDRAAAARITSSSDISPEPRGGGEKRGEEIAAAMETSPTGVRGREEAERGGEREGGWGVIEEEEWPGDSVGVQGTTDDFETGEKTDSETGDRASEESKDG